jgi:disulfide bond formation protein DsbB
MKPFIDQLEKLSEALRDPEYLFLVLEPLQFYGIGIGVLGLIATYFLKNDKLQIAALAVIVISAVSVIPYLGARQSAQERIEKVYKIESPARVKGFTANTQDRLDHRWVFLVLAGVGGMALLVGPRRNRLGLGLAAASVAFGLYAVHFSLWMHYQDSLAFHPNLKINESPVQEKLRAKPAEEPSVPKKKTPSAPGREIRPLTAGTAKP